MAIQAKLYEARIPYELIVVEQDDSQSFNRGKLLNIGFLKAEELGCDYVVFHDVDMIPRRVDYSYAPHPVHLATKDIPFDEYFGGITMFPMEDFKKINGFSNKYWGWGFEDDDLLWRCKLKGIFLVDIPITNLGPNTAALKFNGNSSYVEMENTIRTRGDFSIFVSLQPEELALDENKREDKYTAFGIPGFDLNIMYTSFRRFAVEFFDSKRNHKYVFSDIIPAKKTNIILTYSKDDNVVLLYQDTHLLGKIEMDKNFYLYMRQPKMFLGASSPHREEDQNFFRGYINAFAAWDKTLSFKDIQAIVNNNYFGLGENFLGYTSAGNLTSYYDAKFIRNYSLIDISGISSPAKINDCEIVAYDCPKKDKLLIPFRRESDYRTLKHDDEGFLNTGWKNITTRYNQLKFMNEVIRGYGMPEDDGLTTCEYKVLNHTKLRNVTQMTVKL